MTDDRDRRIERALEGLDEMVPAPDFETTWRAARNRSARSGSRTADAWRWLLGPAIAAVSAVVVAVLVVGDPSQSRSNGAIAYLDGMSGPDAGTLFSDELMEDLELARSDLLEEQDIEAASLGDELYVGETDFMMNMRIPSFEEGDGRNEL